MSSTSGSSVEPKFLDETPIPGFFSGIKKEKIICICDSVIPNYKASSGRTKDGLFKLIADTSLAQQSKIRAMVATARTDRDGLTYVKRKLVNSTTIEEAQSKRRRIQRETDEQTAEGGGPTGPLYADEERTWEAKLEGMKKNAYMKAPTKEQRSKIVDDFIKATGNDAMRTSVCAVCARRLPADDVKTKVGTRDIPNRHLLRPTVPHQDHDLCDDGILLEPAGISRDGDNVHVDICLQCYNSLGRGTQPALALANSMWIGQIPLELRILSLPERILISKYFAVAYIVKLFPKNSNSFAWDRSQMQSGLQGHVSTYQLDPSLIAPYVSKNILPPKIGVLSSTLGVTFVTPAGVPERFLEPFFVVRKQRVEDALRWLKQNNPIYSDIEISTENLDQLPLDGVPEIITAAARHSLNVGGLAKEHGSSYVPPDALDEIEEEDEIVESLNIPMETNQCRENEWEDGALETDTGSIQPGQGPQVIPLLTNGIVDAEGATISKAELLSNALANCAQKSTDAISYRRGNQYVNEYPRLEEQTRTPTIGTPDNPNHLLGCFPVLFPYGRGGLETDREKKVTYKAHIRWCLQYHDKRFRLDLHFIFQVFGVIQKRQFCKSTVLQIDKTAYAANKLLLSQITAEDLIKASEEEAKKIPYSHPGVRVLCRLVKAIRINVDGTDEGRLGCKFYTWGATLAIGNPTVWFTLNPPDSQDPVAQVLAGEIIDLDNFINTSGPDHARRGRNIAGDPVAAGEYFHKMVKKFFEKVLKFEKGNGNHPPQRGMGILGEVQAYVGMVEAQQRGTLHVHILIWLKDTPRTEDIRRALEDAGYRAKIQTFIRDTIKADIDGLDTEGVRSIPKEPGISYSRPINPLHEPAPAVQARIRALARSVQFHKCDQSNCLVPVKGRLVCKRGAPFKLSYTEWINARGEWGPRRCCGYLNNWNDVVLLCYRCNHDIKIIVNGAETCVLVLYIGNYAAKKQNRTTNTSAVLARKVAFHRKFNTPIDDAIDNNRLLLQRCANTLFTQKAFSGPEVVSYLMGWGDRYLSHNYAPIYWDTAVAALCATYPGIRSPVTHSSNVKENAVLSFTNGSLQLKNQLADYQHRGDQLESYNFYKFCIDTYETKLTDKDNESYDSTRGRPRYERIPYRADAGKPKAGRVVRTIGHETLPRLIGQWLPKNNKTEDEEFYGASILTLLSPWRTLNDLKPIEETFAQRCASFISTATPKVQNIIANLQFYHECWDKAAERRDALKKGEAFPIFDYESDVLDSVMAERPNQIEEDEDTNGEMLEVTEELIEMRTMNQQDARETKFAVDALAIARNAGVFLDAQQPSSNPTLPSVDRRAKLEELPYYAQWDKYLKSITRHMVNETGVIDLSDSTGKVAERADIRPAVIEGTSGHTPQPSNSAHAADSLPERATIERGRPLLKMLNSEQRLAHDIVEERLTEELESGVRRPLKLLVHGPGGVGKSLLVSAITETFEYHGQRHTLAKCGSSGIAASNIEGSTIHSWAGLKVGKPKTENWLEKPSDDMKERRDRNICGISTLIIDELSMTTSTVLANLSRVCNTVKLAASECKPDDDFGGMHVIAIADFHQFPPVANETAALYCEPPQDDPIVCLGRELFLRFDHVVMLHQQMRVRDQVWTDILQNLRVGACTSTDIAEIRRLVLTSPECEIPDFSVEPWCDATLITSRHAVREEWNKAAVRRNAKKNSQIVYICPSEDSRKKGGSLSMEERFHIAGTSEKKAGRLAPTIEMFKGMKVMVLLNVATEADVANGTRGVIDDIILDPREDEVLTPDGEGFVKLKYPPSLILFKPDNGCKFTFKGDPKKGVPDVPAGLVPLTPVTAGFDIDMGFGKGKVKVVRRQYSLTAGYAFTDYKSQGQTIEYVIIDIANPPTGKLSPFNAYVTLSRSRGRNSIRLLRDFDDQLFTRHPSESLAKDMVRLERLANQTMLTRGYTVAQVL